VLINRRNRRNDRAQLRRATEAFLRKTRAVLDTGKSHPAEKLVAGVS
jgi:hypothetical protein